MSQDMHFVCVLLRHASHPHKFVEAERRIGRMHLVSRGAAYIPSQQPQGNLAAAINRDSFHVRRNALAAAAADP
jgi:hypothetical protein